MSEIHELKSPNLVNQVTLDTLRETLAQDRKLITRHPVLKHLFLRYEAIVNQITPFGYPQARIEPTAELYDRLNELTVVTAQKDQIRRKRRNNRTRTQEQIKAAKEKGRNNYRRNNAL